MRGRRRADTFDSHYRDNTRGLGSRSLDVLSVSDFEHTDSPMQPPQDSVIKPTLSLKEVSDCTLRVVHIPYTMGLNHVRIVPLEENVLRCSAVQTHQNHRHDSEPFDRSESVRRVQ